MSNRIGDCPCSPLARAAVLVLAGVFIRSTAADVVWINGQSTPMSGQIVASTPEQIELRVFENGELGRVEKIARSRIEQLITNIDTQRLEQLSPENPAGYRDYAEELASQRIDPAARKLAQRLYLIAASISSGGNGTSREICNSAMAGLISLSESEADRGRLLMLRFLISPDADAMDVVPASKRSIPGSAEHAKLMLELVQSIRMENSDHAVKLLSSENNREIFQKWSDICSLEEIDRIAGVNRPSKPQLSKLLQIELQILTNASASTGETPEAVPSGRQFNWGDFATQGSGFLGVVPSFENITAMDPRESVYRSGRWLRPESRSNQ